MNINRYSGVFIAVFFLLAACEKAPERLTELRLATGGKNGIYYAYGTALGGILEQRLNLPVNVIATAASAANIAHIENGAADFAFTQNDVMTYAYNGTNLFSASGAQKDFAAVAGLYSEVCHVIAAESIADFGDLKGKRVSTGENGSGTVLNAAQIFEAFGMNFAGIKEFNLSFGESAEALAAGRIDAFFCTAGAPTPAIAGLAGNVTFKLLPVGDARTQLLISNYPYYTAHTVSAGTYKGIDVDVNTVAVRATLIASTKVSAEDVYAVTKALFESKTDSAAHPKAAELSAESAVSGIPVPFHAGALRYYRELGLLK